MSAAERVARMLTLVPWLLERPGASLEETAEAFGVDRATVRADLRELDFCGVPGLGGAELFEVALYGDRVILRMADELRRPLRLTAREGLHLVIALGAVADALGDELPALRSALAKVRAALGIPEEVAAQLDTGRSRWVGAARGAVEHGRRVRLVYRGRRDEAAHERTVDAWGLQVHGGSWYLQGHDAGAGGLRTFRLDRIVDLEVLDEARRRDPPREPLPAPEYSPAPDDTWVQVHLEGPARWVAEAVRVAEREELGDGRLRIGFHTDAPRHIARLLLAAGAGVDVVEPGWLRDRVRRLAEEALARYGDAEG